MDASVTTAVVKQHLIDPEICIRCNTCEETCPVHAITHDSRNYVVRADVCGSCLACIAPCPTGAIDNWRVVAAAQTYPIDEQLLWDVLPPAPASITEDPGVAVAPPAANAGGGLPPSRRHSPTARRARRFRRPVLRIRKSTCTRTASLSRRRSSATSASPMATSKATHTTSSSISARSRSPYSKANRSACCRPVSTRRGVRMSRASIRCRARAMANGAATTTSP